MINAKTRIEEIRNNGYRLDFGTVFENSVEIYKKIALNGGLVMLLIGIIVAIFALGVIGTLVGFAEFSNTMANYNPESTSGSELIIRFILVVVITVAMSPVTAGLLKMAHLADRNEEFSFGTAFEYYKNSYLKEIIISSFIVASLNAGLDVGFEVLGFKIIGSILSVIIAIFTVLYLQFIIFGNLNAIEAIEGSIKVVSKHFLLILLILFVAIILSLLGGLACCIGILFTLPFLNATYYCLYKHSVGIDNTSELDQIGQNND